MSTWADTNEEREYINALSAAQSAYARVIAVTRTPEQRSLALDALNVNARLLGQIELLDHPEGDPWTK